MTAPLAPPCGNLWGFCVALTSLGQWAGGEVKMNAWK